MFIPYPEFKDPPHIVELKRKRQLHDLAIELLPIYTELHKTATMAQDEELQEIARAKLLKHLANIME